MNHEPAAERSPWLFGPSADIVFLANAAWPLLAAVVYFASPPVGAGMALVRRFFFVQPHRWITLGLVFLDRARFEQRRAAFLGVAALCAAVFAGLWLATGQLALILALDVLWNAWHGASQHQGIAGIYARQAAPKSGIGRGWEGALMRGFLFYSLCRIVTVVTALPYLPYPPGVIAAFAQLNRSLGVVDCAVALVPVFLFGRELLSYRRELVGRYVYLFSVYTHHGLTLYAAHVGDMRLLVALGLVNGMFHATEYMAMVTWSVQKRKGQPGAGVFRELAREWGAVMAVYVVLLGASAWFMQERYLTVWLGLSTFVSYLHYAYDGMIWKRRAPVSAAHPALVAQNFTPART